MRFVLPPVIPAVCGPTRTFRGVTPRRDPPGGASAVETQQESAMREYVWLECTVCKDRNYRVQKETRGAERLELNKYCRRERKHTSHKESRKK